MKKISVGMVGYGAFGCMFVPIFQAHPLVSEVYVADVVPERLAAAKRAHGIRHVFNSIEELCASDVDAVLVFSQRHMHGPHVMKALRRGKHVYSAVPASGSVEELHEIIRIVEETGLTYMMGETSYYYPGNIFCRNKFDNNEFGRFVYGEGEYLHDMSHGFYDAFKHSGGANWKRVAGVPPMYYPTHSVAMILAVTGARMTQVSCLGFRDQHEDGIFREGANLWDNPFSNQTALFRTSDGGMARVNEFRRTSVTRGNCVRLSIFGTEGSFEQQADDNCCWVTLDGKIKRLNEALDASDTYTEEQIELLKEKTRQQGVQDDFYSGYAPIHPTERLPEAIRKVWHNGHYGSHHFLVDDFVKACAYKLLPPVHAWEAAKYTAPGLIAHDSSLQEGALLEVPDFGAPPEGSQFLADHMEEISREVV